MQKSFRIDADGLGGRGLRSIPRRRMPYGCWHVMTVRDDAGIEQGIRKRLDGLTYTMSSQALMPDDRIVAWVLASVR